MATKYSGTQSNRICSSGGHVRVTLTSGTGQGNGGTSLPCKGCFVSVTTTQGIVRINIDAAASDTVGIDIPDATVANPLFIPIDDVASLYFYSSDVDAVIDITVVCVAARAYVLGNSSCDEIRFRITTTVPNPTILASLTLSLFTTL